MKKPDKCETCRYQVMVSQDGDVDCSKGHNYEKTWRGYCSEHSSGKNENIFQETALEKLAS